MLPGLITVLNISLPYLYYFNCYTNVNYTVNTQLNLDRLDSIPIELDNLSVS